MPDSMCFAQGITKSFPPFLETYGFEKKRKKNVAKQNEKPTDFYVSTIPQNSDIVFDFVFISVVKSGEH